MNMENLLTKGMNTKKTLADFVHRGLKRVERIERDGRTWVSQVSVCPRQGALAATFVGDSEETAAKEFYCEFGNTAEEIILRGWYNSGILLFADYALPDIGINLGGKIDAIVVYNGKITVAEVKTCGTKMPTKPKLTHFAQASLYSAITGLPYVIYYQSRNVADYGNNLKAKEFAFEFNGEALKVNMFNAVYAHLCVEAGVMPNKYIMKNDERCGFCNFTNVCWEDGIPHMNIASSKDYEELANLASYMTLNFMRPADVAKRRNGVVKHLSIHGTKHAVALLGNEKGKPGKSWGEYL